MTDTKASTGLFCGECGVRAQGGRFCTNCGRPLSVLTGESTDTSAVALGVDDAEQSAAPGPRWWRRRLVWLIASAAAALLLVVGGVVGIQQAQAQAHAHAVAAAQHAAVVKAQQTAAKKALEVKAAAQKAAAAAATVAAAKAQDASDKAGWDQKAQADAAAFMAAESAAGGDGQVSGFAPDATPTWSTIDDLYSCTVSHCVITFRTTSLLPSGTTWGGPGGLACVLVSGSTVCSQTNIQDPLQDGGQTITRSADMTGLVPAGATITEFFLGDPTSHAPNVTPIQTRIHVQAG